MQIPLSVSQIEAATLTAWPALRQAHDGLWVWRYAKGFTKRSNSVHCLDPADGAYAEIRLQRMIGLSERHGIAPVFRVTPLTAPEVVDVLDGLFWDAFEPSLVMAMEMPNEDFPVEGHTELFDPNDPAWYKAQASMSGYSADTIAIFRQILAVLACDARGALVYHKAGLPVSAALVAVYGSIAIYLNVVTHPNARGMGYGTAVMSAALNWARSVGATHSALQVLEENRVGQKLYQSLGFGEVYTYHYRRPHVWATE